MIQGSADEFLLKDHIPHKKKHTFYDKVINFSRLHLTLVDIELTLSWH